MNQLYIITGPAGVGKSTVSKEIAGLCEKSALIEGDEIYNLVCGGYVSPWKEGNHMKVFWENSIDIIRNFLDNGYDVVFNYIINKQEIEILKKNFNDAEVKFIVLIVDEETIVKRDAMRPEDCQMKERSLILLEEMKRQSFNESNLLDTSKLSVEETVKTILEEERFALK
ncbi:MAG: AAA family ATPase [Clostridia bacterium]|nr:AAA family ATPase [Clostridia bacterium]